MEMTLDFPATRTTASALVDLELTPVLDRAVAAAARVFEALPHAIAVIDIRGRLVAANCAARNLPDCLSAIARAGSEVIARLEIEPGPVGLAVSRPSSMLWLVAARMDGDSGDRELFTVTVCDALAPHPVTAGVIAQLCGLTRCEATAARMILQGAAPKTMARALGVSLATVKTHLHRVFSKTGAAGQADLARRLARLLPPTVNDALLSPQPGNGGSPYRKHAQ